MKEQLHLPVSTINTLHLILPHTLDFVPLPDVGTLSLMISTGHIAHARILLSNLNTLTVWFSYNLYRDVFILLAGLLA